MQSRFVGLFDGIQSVLDPRGPAAELLAEMAWVLVVGAALVFVAVMALAAYAVFARRERSSRMSARALIVGGGIVFPAVTLSALLLYTLWRLTPLEAADEAALRIEVVGEQWWWRVRYPEFETANEIRIPVGRPVEVLLKSADVIHSFWVPALHGKLDMVPGRTNRLRLQADAPGEFRGQCAEYCGGPHAFMAFFVVALAPEDYQRWAEAQRKPAPVSNDFFNRRCGACHTVRGTRAAGVLGPDLTHFGSRRTIGAGLLPNNAGATAGWIASSQHLKPGNLMPSFPMFSGEELRGLAAYLESLE
jgi:cytochrome c oxidase subunit 2